MFQGNKPKSLEKVNSKKKIKTCSDEKATHTKGSKKGAKKVEKKLAKRYTRKG